VLEVSFFMRKETAIKTIPKMNAKDVIFAVISEKNENGNVCKIIESSGNCQFPCGKNR
tara:strand:- start:67 stop:240 length:174 start_codon:yes stop_codon:yes gene_type:complete